MDSNLPKTQVGVYARISQDELGLEKGVTRQIEDAREIAAQRGWEIVAEYTDNDVSAFSGATRQGYDCLMADAEAGRFGQIICWQTSRLWRNRAERSQAINRLGQLRISITAVRGPELDLGNASGRFTAGLLGEFDSMVQISPRELL